MREEPIAPIPGGMPAFRPDIQGLRALAVTLVLLFHLFPDFLPGGYIGVDVFFVISGYLMTALLLREADTTGRVSLIAFYARRVRRLLPAATVVLLAVALAAPLLPEVRWIDTAWDIIASAFYVENWRLAWLAVDYLGAESAPSPVQHFWSLSIEEQFYFIWPLLVLATLLVASRAAWDFRRILRGALISLIVVSFIASATITPDDPGLAYFGTHTRIWELALGGLVAFIGPVALSGRSREAIRVLSLAAIVAASLLFSQKTDFPGSAAALPTLATVIMLVVGQANASGVTYRLLSLPPIQYVGDTSYSIYLWHWPIIIFAGALMAGGAMSPGQQLILIGAILVSSHFSKTLIEDRFRKAPRATANLTRTVALGAPSALACSSLAALALMLVAYEPGLRNSVLALTSATRVEFNPPLSEVKGDLPEIYRDGCFATAEDVAPRPCQYGDRDGAVHVMLLGDSHAAQWLPALSILAHQQHWRLSVHAKGACPFVTQMVEKNQKPYEACLEWDKRVLAELQAGPPDVVIISQVSDKRLFGQKPRPELMAAALAATWRELRALGATVIVLRDTPVFNLDPTDCLSQNVNCAGRLRDVSRPSPIPIALALQPEVQSIDMTDQLCPDGRCSAAIGNLVVWRDKHHLTATFAKTLAPVLGQRIATILHSLTVATRIVAP